MALARQHRQPRRQFPGPACLLRILAEEGVLLCTFPTLQICCRPIQASCAPHLRAISTRSRSPRPARFNIDSNLTCWSGFKVCTNLSKFLLHFAKLFGQRFRERTDGNIASGPFRLDRSPVVVAVIARALNRLSRTGHVVRSPVLRAVVAGAVSQARAAGNIELFCRVVLRRVIADC